MFRRMALLVGSAASVAVVSSFLAAQTSAPTPVPGDLDTTFGQNGMTTVSVPGTSSTESGNALAIQPDGKPVVVGTADNTIAIMRLNTDGTLDSSFGLGGKTTSTVGYEGDAVAIQSDGKIVVGGLTGSGPQFIIARFLTNGTLDQSFGTSGATAVSIGSGVNFLHAIALQGDGKIIAVGQASSSESDFGVVRLNTNGSLDASFGSGGRVTTDFPGPGGSFDAANAVTVQSDGKILVAGVTASQPTGDTFGVARYLTNGALDSTFGTNGLLTFTLGNRHSAAYAIGVQSTGQIIVAGEVEGADAGGITGGLMLGRLNLNGTLDGTFGTFPGFPGIAEVEFTNSIQNTGRSMAIYPDDSILMGGSLQLSGQSLDYQLSAFDSNGGFLSAFSHSANLSAAYREEGRAVVRIPSGGALLIGNTDQNDSGDIGAVNTGASISWPVRSFGAFPVSAINGTVSSMTLQSDGKIVAVGSAGSYPAQEITVMRVNPNGTQDGTFGNSGFALVSLDGQDSGGGVAVQPDGKIVLSGIRNNTASTNYRCVLLRFNTDGSLDSTFGTDGVATFDTSSPGGQFQVLYRTIVQPDGKIVGIGNSNGHMLAVRVLSNGALDPGFATGGIFKGTAASTAAYRVTLQSDSKILLVGSTQPQSMIAVRLNTDGSLDTSFGSGGIVTPAPSYQASAVAIQQDGKIIMAGGNATDAKSFAAVRLLTNGTLDTTFGSGGTFTYSSPNLSVVDAAIQTDGRIVLGGENCGNCVPFNGGQGLFALWRLLPSGNLDPSFGNNGLATTTFPNKITNLYTDGIAGIGIQPDGKIDAVGNIQGGAGPNGIGLARFIGSTNITTAAGVNVSGRVLTPTGSGLRNARVTLTDQYGATRTVITGAFGYYTFDSVDIGKSYVISVASRRFTYASQVVTLTDSLTDLDFSPQ